MILLVRDIIYCNSVHYKLSNPAVRYLSLKKIEERDGQFSE